MRDVASINAEAGRVREQAQMLHDAGNKVRETTFADYAKRAQVAQRQQATAQADAERADQQVAVLERMLADRRANEADAAREASAVAAKDPARAEELREIAAHRRAEAVGVAETLDAAKRAAADARAAAEAAAAAETRIRAEYEDVAQTAIRLEKMADQLDNKAAYLEDAARLERTAIDAEGEGDRVKAQEQRQLADDAEMRADRIRVDVSSIDPKLLRDAGVDLSKAPGMELLDPSDEAAVTTSRSAAALADPGVGIDDLGGEATDGTPGSAADALDGDVIAASGSPVPAAAPAGMTDLTGDLDAATGGLDVTSLASARTGTELEQPPPEAELERPAEPEPLVADAAPEIGLAPDPSPGPSDQEPEPEPEPEFSEGA